MRNAFVADFIKMKRTPVAWLQLLVPVVLTALYFIYYSFAGYHIIQNVWLFFVIIQIGYPIGASILVPILIGLERRMPNVQNALGVVPSRHSVYFGKLCFLLCLSAASILVFEMGFYIGVNHFLGLHDTKIQPYLIVFVIMMISNIFLYSCLMTIAFRFGTSIVMILGIAGTVLAGYFETPIGNHLWQFMPWEWGVRLLENYFEISVTPVLPGIIVMIVMTFAMLAFSIYWFSRWEGRVADE
ncbi:lantibiotic immunity ABC transporter MutG family permease subunit [Fusibacter paucivorans]